MTDEFYVGYASKAPPGIARATRRITILLLAGALGLAAILLVSQQPFAPSVFEYGLIHAHEGDLSLWPYPLLRTKDATFLLVAKGKRGASLLVAGLDGKRVRLNGTLIQRGEARAIEVEPGVIDLGAAPSSATLVPIHWGEFG